MSQNSDIYRISFISDKDVYEIYAKNINQDPILFGFVEISDIIFNQNSGVVVDPSEERLKTEFAEVKKTFVPVHSILRIDQVKKEGIPKIKEVKSGSNSNISQFPGYTTPPITTR